MTLELINLEGLPAPPTYTHLVVAAGTRMVFIAGQEPEDAHANLIGPGDLPAGGTGRALASAPSRDPDAAVGLGQLVAMPSRLSVVN
jgi:hypothetical protein